LKLQYQEYRPRKIVNVHRHVDGPWFWDKYSAHPYIGCRSGCEFCHLRGGRYLGRRDPQSFDTLIQVKVNAAELLRKELARLEPAGRLAPAGCRPPGRRPERGSPDPAPPPLRFGDLRRLVRRRSRILPRGRAKEVGAEPEIIACGDWQQPAEDRYRLSRAMLEIVHDLGFPLFIVERSPLLTRDLDLLAEINRRSRVCVALSLSNLDPALKQAFEPRSPGLRRRLQAMQALAKAGILVGTALMPVLPGLGDDEAHLEQAVRATADHGGAFVLAGGLSMEGVQAERTLEALRRFDPPSVSGWRQFFHWQEGGQPRYGPPPAYSARLGQTVRELCQRHGLRHRIPRTVAPGPRAINKRIAERLFLAAYDLELEQAASYRIWAYRKAAWAIDEWPESLDELYRAGGEARLQQIPAVGKSLAVHIGRWLGQGG